MSRKGAWLWVEAVCSGCAETLGGKHVRSGQYARVGLEEIAADVSRCGWFLDPFGDWYCTACRKSYNRSPSLAQTEDIYGDDIPANYGL